MHTWSQNFTGIVELEPRVFEKRGEKATRHLFCFQTSTACHHRAGNCHRLPLPREGQVGAAKRSNQSPEPEQAAWKHVSRTEHPGDGATGRHAGPWEAPVQLLPPAQGSARSCQGSQETTAGAGELQREDFPPDPNSLERFFSPRLRTQEQAETISVAFIPQHLLHTDKCLCVCGMCVHTCMWSICCCMCACV